MINWFILDDSFSIFQSSKKSLYIAWASFRNDPGSMYNRKPCVSLVLQQIFTFVLVC